MLARDSQDSRHAVPGRCGPRVRDALWFCCVLSRPSCSCPEVKAGPSCAGSDGPLLRLAAGLGALRDLHQHVTKVKPSPAEYRWDLGQVQGHSVLKLESCCSSRDRSV